MGHAIAGALGLVAGVLGSVTGVASLIRYPALLWLGLTPVAANVTNAVAPVLGGVGSAAGSRVELRGQGVHLGGMAPAGVLGGIVAGMVLLRTPGRASSGVRPSS